MASILPNGKTQFVDQNGKPLANGTVTFYAPGTTTKQDTWQDQAQTQVNTNPVVLDSRGQATIWGSGSYRQVVADKNAVVIWDQVVTEPGSQLSAPGGSLNVGFQQRGTGATSRTVQDKAREVVSWQDFGLVGDPNADNTTALMSFNAQAKQYPDRCFELLLPAGMVTFTRPDWMQGIKNFKLKGATTILFNKSTNPISTQNIPLVINQDLMLDNASGGIGGTFNPGYLIATVARFSTSVMMLSAGDAANFSPNTWALIHGYNQGSGGYPASIRYFEYVRIIGVNVNTGVITFERPLLNKYRQDWLDVQNNAPQAAIGAARLLPLTRAGFNLCESAELENIIFAPSTGAVAGRRLVAVGFAIHVRLPARRDSKLSHPRLLLPDRVPARACAGLLYRVLRGRQTDRPRRVRRVRDRPDG